MKSCNAAYLLQRSFKRKSYEHSPMTPKREVSHELMEIKLFSIFSRTVTYIIPPPTVKSPRVLSNKSYPHHNTKLAAVNLIKPHTSARTIARNWLYLHLGSYSRLTRLSTSQNPKMWRRSMCEWRIRTARRSLSVSLTAATIPQIGKIT